MNKIVLALACALGIASCASTPDVTVTYFLPKTTVNAKVTRTITCDAESNLILASSTVLTPVHAADISKPQTFDVSRLDGLFVNTTFSMDLTEDGRLKGVNTTSKGQAGEVVKTGIELLSSKLGLMNAPRYPEHCDLINKYKRDANGNVVRTETLTITYEGVAESTPNSSAIPILKSTILDGRFNELLALIGQPMIKTGEASPIAPTVAQDRIDIKKYPTLAVRQMSSVLYTVMISGDETLPQFRSDKLHEQSLLVAMPDASTYSIPLPKSAAFGNTNFAVAMNESGAVTKLTYGSDSGAPQLIGAASAFPDKEADLTTAQRAAEIKAQADLIAQQARLVRCQAAPDACT